MTQTTPKAVLNPIAMVGVALATAALTLGCTEQPQDRRGNPAPSAESSDQVPGGSTTIPTTGPGSGPGGGPSTGPGGGPGGGPGEDPGPDGGPSEDPGPDGDPSGPGGNPTQDAEQSIPPAVPGENPGNGDGDPSSLALASLPSAKLEQRFAVGLQLDRREMCKELGTANCFGRVFSPALGNSQPQSRVTAPANPAALAPVAIERIARQVCRLRRQKDTALGDKAEVFKFFDLGRGEPSAAAVAQQASFLYQRLLARQPSADELAATKLVLGHGLSGGDIAETLCFAVAGSLEILFSPL